MPEMDGITCTKEIRRLEELEQQVFSVPIVALTANLLQDTPQLCKEAGFSDFLSKPVRKHDLFEMVKKWTHLERVL
jgi:CheY-like chemotaxis protein